MNGRHTILFAAGCAFLATGVLSQDRAVPRSGGRSSGSSARSAPSAPSGRSSGASSRPAPSTRSYGTSSRRSGSSSPATSYRAPSRGLTTAERRHPRAGTGTGSRYGGYYPSHPIYPGYPGWGWGGYSPYWSYWWPYRSYGYGYGYGYGWGGGYAPGGGGTVYSYAETDRASVRVLVDPSEARVYVDGYYAGVVDDFDGLFQRLHVAPGRHEISLKLTGYKTHRVRFYAGSGSTLKLDFELQEGTGETFQDLTPGAAPVQEARSSLRSYGETPRVERQDEAPAEEVRLRVSPVDASVYVDGEFRGTGREATTLALTPGPHRIEVVRPGYRTEDREVQVGGPMPAELTIELEKP